MLSSDRVLFATPSQCALETQATLVFGSERIQTALAAIYDLAEKQPQASLKSGSSTLRQAMQEIAFAYVLRNLNDDATTPKILWDQNPPHVVDGVSIPGSRAIGNNPDNIYRRIPLSADEQYCLRGKILGPVAADVRFSVLPHFSMQADIYILQCQSGLYPIGLH